MSSSTSFTYKTDASAGAIPAVVHYKPADPSITTPRPAVLILHAGGYVCGGTFMIPRAQIDALLDLGFVVITPEYRLCPQVSVREGPITDVRECLAWTRSSLPSLLQADAGVTIDPARVAVMGHSAGGNLALHLGGEAQPPSAILSFYPPIYLEREFFHKPLLAFARMPDTEVAFQDKVFEGPVPFVSTPMITREGKPDLASSRSAWMIANLKAGTQMAKVVRDGDYAAMDGVRQIKKGFPATAILQGTADVFAPAAFAEEAARELKELGIDTEYIAVEGKAHMYDMQVARGQAGWEEIQKGLNFLAKHV